MSLNDKIRLLSISETELSCRTEASQLIFDANPEFYEIFGDKKNVLSVISKLFGETRSDISNGVVALDNGCVAGICTWVSSKNLSSSQKYHLHHLSTKFAGGSKELSSKIKTYRDRFEPAHKLKSLYLSRIAVSKDHMGTGLSSEMVSEFMRHAKTEGFGSLHVKEDNLKAIKFYHKMGFYFANSLSQVSTKRHDYDHKLMVTKRWG